MNREIAPVEYGQMLCLDCTLIDMDLTITGMHQHNLDVLNEMPKTGQVLAQTVTRTSPFGYLHFKYAWHTNLLPSWVMHIHLLCWMLP